MRNIIFFVFSLLLIGCKPVLKEEGVKILLEDMNDWQDAPIWDKNSIAKATEKWFEHLG